MVTYAITGASKGLGLEMCKQLAARGETVYALVRSGNSKLAELGSSVKVVEGIDVTKVPWQNARVQFSASSAMSTHLSQKSPRPPPPPPHTHTHTHLPMVTRLFAGSQWCSTAKLRGRSRMTWGTS